MSVNKPVAAVGGILTALSGSWVGYCMYQSVHLYPHSAVLTDEVIKDVCQAEFMLSIGMIGVISLVLSLILLSLGLRWRYSTDNGTNAKVIFITYFVIVIIAFALTLPEHAKRAYDIKTHEPHIESVTLVDAYKKRSRRSTSYYVVFSNGSKDRSSSTEFSRYHVGDEFYVVMCGDSCVEHYAVDQYSLS